MLLHELKTYSKPHVSGHVEVLDTTDPNDNIEPLRAMLEPGKSAIFCIPQELIHFRSPFREIIGAKDQTSPIAAIIPTQVVQAAFERLIDLRMPETRHWFVKEFTGLNNSIAKEFTRLKTDDLSLPVFPLAGPLDHFKDLLPTLLAQGLGNGSGATQVAGAWLRRLGAEALIFLSARVDISVSISHGELQDWYGWNLVDYRNAPPPTVNAFHVFSEWDKYPTALHHDLMSGESDNKSPPLKFSHVKIIANESGPNAGSMSVTGIELARGFYRDFGLWKFYTDKMDRDLGDALSASHSLLHPTEIVVSIFEM